jgi:photosystem II stability/assembly factor-like uncharacterized protein
MGGVINTIELQPGNPEIVFAGGFGGVFKSITGGASWEPLPQFIPAAGLVYDLLIHPTDPLIMYASAGRLYKTINGGQSWKPLNNEGGSTCVAMDPANPDRLLTGDYGSVFLSIDGGATWDNITANLPDLPVKDVAFGVGQELWAGTAADPETGLGLLYHSLNSGTSWHSVNLGQPADSEIQTIFLDPENQDIIYVGLMNIHNEPFNAADDVYLLKSTNGGRSWNPIHLPSMWSMITLICRVAGDIALYVADGGRLYQSIDGGQNWVEISPVGRNGDLCDIAVDPRNIDMLYLPRRANGVLKSSDRGHTWTPINDGLLNTSISLLALGDASGSIIYAASNLGEGTFRSTDFGNTWINVTAGGIDHPWSDELVVSPTDSQTIWEVADVGKVFVSRDSGNTWSLTINPYEAGFRAGTISAMAIAPSDSSRLYALKSGFGIFKSTEGGDWWSFLHQSEVDYTYSIAVHPANPDIVFSGYSPKPFQDSAMVRRSEDGGVTWSTALSVPHSGGITSVAIDSKAPNSIYAGSTGTSSGGGGQIYHSTDGGDSWLQLNPHFNMLTVWGQPQLVGDPHNPSNVYAATWLAGTWKTIDAGQTWTKLQDAPQSSTSLSLDQANPNVIYAADRTAPTLWKSTDAGITWSSLDFSFSGAFLVNRVLVANGNVYLSTFGPGIHGGKLYVSHDDGLTWSDITGTLPRSVLDIAIDPANSQVLYVTTHIHGAYKSTDGGITWAEMAGFPNIGGYDIEVDPASPNTIYAAGMGAATVPDWVLAGGYALTDPSGVYKSADGGQSWSRILTTSNECRAIRIHPANPNLLVVSALSDGFFVSADGGAHWINDGDGLDTHNLTSVWSAGNKIYAGTQGFGVYAGEINTTTGEVTWVPARSNKPIPDVHNIQIQVDPSDSSRIYVGSNPGGLFRSDDGGNSWFDKNFLTPSVIVDDPKRQGYYTFAINPANPNEVWVGTWGRGVYKSYDGQDFNIGASGGDHILFSKHVNALLFHPTLGVLAATEEGVSRTDNGGSTWKAFSDGLDTPQVRTLNISSNGTVFAGTAGYELYSRQPSDSHWTQVHAFGNFGTFWPIWNNRPLYQYSTLLFHPNDPEVIYFGTFPAGIFKSLDRGITWREYNVGWLNDGVFCLIFHSQDANTIYAGTYNGVSRSFDGGLHWERWDKGWPGEQWVFSIAFDPHDPNIMYACSKNGENEGKGREDFHGTVMKSSNGGASWFPITVGLDLNNEFYKIIVDWLSPDTLYLATQRDGVFISYDGGGHWQPWNDCLTNTVAGTNGNNVTNSMALSHDGAYLYFGSKGSGVFRRVTSQRDRHETGILPNNVANSGSVAAKFWRYYTIDVPSAQSLLKVDVSSTSGDIDLYLRHSFFPTLENYDCASNTRSRNETCTVNEPNDGKWYIGVYGSGAGKTEFSILATYGLILTHMNLMIPAGGEMATATLGAFTTTRSGYAELTLDSGAAPYGTAVFNFRQNGVTVGEAGVPASPPTTAARVFIDYRSSVPAISGRLSSGTINVNTGIAVVNYASAPATVTYTLRNVAGATLSIGRGTPLAAGAHFAKFIDQLNEVAPDFVLPSGFQILTQFASLEISSDQPLSILALRMTTNQRNEVLYTTTPTADLTKPATNDSIFFPQLADGGGNTTSLILLNTSNGTETGTLQILDNDGNPFVVNQVGGTAGSVFRYSIPSDGVFRFQTDGSPAITKSGWARLTPDAGTSAPVGAGVFGYNPGNFLVAESGVPASVSTTHARVYVDLSGGHNTGLAIANLTNTYASITITAFQSDGVTGIGTSHGPLLLPPNGHEAHFANEFVAGFPDGFVGVLDIISSTPFAALTLRSLNNERNDFLLATFPVADMTRAAPAPIVFPQIADGGGLVTQFILIGAGGASSVIINFYGNDGKPLAIGR